MRRLAIGFILLGLSVWSLAQTSQTGTLRGTVYDQSGQGLPGVTILAGFEDGSYRKTLYTDDKGSFQAGFLKPGIYKVTAQMTGFQTQDVKGLVVEATSSRDIKITMKVSEVSEILVVEATLPMIEKESQELSSSLNADSIERLPMSRNVNDLVNFTAGASSSGIYGGSGSQANNYTMDGVSVNSTGYGGSFLLPNVNWIKDYQVKGLGAGAEYGNFQGGMINMVTKSGSNTFEGGAHLIFEQGSWNSTNLKAGDSGSEVDSFTELDVDVSGAFIPDRLYYFFSVEQQQENSNVIDYQSSLESGDLTFFNAREERTETKLYSKITWQLNPENNLNFVLGVDNVETDNRGLGSFTTLNATETQDSPSILYNLSWEKTLNASNFLEVKLTGYNGEDNRNSKYGDIAGVQVLGGDRNLGRNATYDRLRDLANNTLSITYNGFFNWGLTTHHIKAGGDYNQGTWLEQRIRNGGLTWRPEVDSDLVSNFENPESWGFISSDWGGGIRLDAETLNASVYAQDYINVTEGIDLSIGLRYGKWEGRITPGFSSGGQFTALSDSAVAPRIGLTADLFKNQKWIAKIHWGQYYQSMFALLYDRVLGADAFQDEEYWDWIGNNLPDLNADYNLQNREEFFEFYDSAPTSQEVGRVENYSQPYVDQLVLGLEHQLTDTWKIGLSYINRENQNILSLVDKNLDSNYTALHDIEVVNYRTGDAELDHEGNPLYLDTLYIRSENYDPDYVLTKAENAYRKLDQIQLEAEGFSEAWSFNFSLVHSDLKGNFYSVSGYDDPSGTGAGAFVYRNQQINFDGNLRNQPEWVTKVRLTRDLPWDFRLGLYYLLESGSFITPTYSIDTRNDDFYDSNGDWIDYHLFTDVDGEQIFLTQRGSLELDDYSRLDLRVEKIIPFQKSRILLTLDAFNLFNADAATIVETGVNGQDPTNPGSLFGSVRSTQRPRTLQFRASFKW